MPGGFFSCTGSVSAPNKSWFGAIPDRLTMLMPVILGPGGWQLQAYKACSFVNQMGIWNPAQQGGTNTNSVSFGSFTTAPDGTTSVAQHMTENSTGSIVHSVMGGYATDAFNTVGGPGVPDFTMRLGVIAKAAERTRIALYVTNGQGTGPLGSGATGCKTVFDLAGVQIGVANTAFGTAAASGAASISSLGAGWCLCTMDIKVNAQTPTVSVALDNGSGTGAESTTYTGDGTSGVYVWRSTYLPPGAFGLNNQVFFDDFLSSSTIDLNNTKAPGFNWYLDGSCPRFGSVTPTPSSAVNVAGSVVTLSPFVGLATGSFMMFSAAFPSLSVGSSWVGNTWRGSMLTETKLSYRADLSNGGSHISFWTTAAQTQNEAEIALGGLKNIEDDLFEVPSGGGSDYVPEDNFDANQIGTLPIISNAPGAPLWFSTISYSQNSIVFRLGQLYKSLVAGNQSNLNNPPESSPADWSVYSPSPVQPASASNWNLIDFTQLNTWSFLKIIPTGSEPGHRINFFNGILAQSLPLNVIHEGQMVYGPNVPSGNSSSSGMFQVGDGADMMLLMGPDMPIGLTMSIDWVKVTQ